MDKQKERFLAEQEEMRSLNLEDMDVEGLGQRLEQRFAHMRDGKPGCKKACPNNSGG